MGMLLFSPALWRFVAAAAVALAIGAFVMHYRAIRADAELVPGLEASLAHDDARASALVTRLAAVTAARDAADRALTLWQGDKTQILNAIKKEASHAIAATDPVCAPGADDRRVRNAAAARLLGPEPASGTDPVPAAAAAPH